MIYIFQMIFKLKFWFLKQYKGLAVFPSKKLGFPGLYYFGPSKNLATVIFWIQFVCLAHFYYNLNSIRKKFTELKKSIISKFFWEILLEQKNINF
jgi:hypothetical protein